MHVLPTCLHIPPRVPILPLLPSPRAARQCHSLLRRCWHGPAPLATPPRMLTPAQHVIAHVTLQATRQPPDSPRTLHPRYHPTLTRPPTARRHRANTLAASLTTNAQTETTTAVAYPRQFPPPIQLDTRTVAPTPCVRCLHVHLRLRDLPQCVTLHHLSEARLERLVYLLQGAPTLDVPRIPTHVSHVHPLPPTCPVTAWHPQGLALGSRGGFET